MMQFGSQPRCLSDFAPPSDNASQPTLAHRRPRANVLGIAVDALDMERALSVISDELTAHRKGYICAISVHGVLEARKNRSVADAFAGASLIVPDGTPVVWVGRAQGHRDMRQVTGPYLMREIFRREAFRRFTHFFYGGREGVAQELATVMRARFPDVRILGTYTPPFRDLTTSEEADLIATINNCRPDIVWVGIGAPRQELLMRHLLPYLDTTLMFGVGAAFDFHTGHIRDSSDWIKHIGLQWLHRLAQDPKRLWRRNLRNSAFLWHIALQILRLRKYEAAPDRMNQNLWRPSGGYSQASTGSSEISSSGRTPRTWR